MAGDEYILSFLFPKVAQVCLPISSWPLLAPVCLPIHSMAQVDLHLHFITKVVNCKHSHLCERGDIFAIPK